MSLEQFGKNLKHFRNHSGMTQEQFAKKVFAARAMIARIEKGRYKPSIALVERICDAFDQDITGMLKKDLAGVTSATGNDN